MNFIQNFAESEIKLEYTVYKDQSQMLQNVYVGIFGFGCHRTVTVLNG